MLSSTSHPTMKKLKHLKKLVKLIEEFSSELKKETDKLKKEHSKHLILSNTELITKISEGEGIDIVYLLDKYLDKKPSSEKESKQEEKFNEDDELLSLMTFRGEQYFYEDKEEGKVFDNTSNCIGVFRQGKINFNSKSTELIEE